MKNKDQFPDHFKQNKKLPIRIVSPGFGHLSPGIAADYGLMHRKPYYFFLFMLEGSTRHDVDLEQFDISGNQLLLVLPYQVHRLPATNHGTDYFKIGFDEHCLSLLPKQYPLLINPLNTQKITLAPPVAIRLKSIFELLPGLLSSMDTDPELILAHLNTLLTEINMAYFIADENPADDKLSKYIGFKVFVENNLTDHPLLRISRQNLPSIPTACITSLSAIPGFRPKSSSPTASSLKPGAAFIMQRAPRSRSLLMN